MIPETEELLDEVLIELLKFFRRINRKAERDQDEYRFLDSLSQRHGYPPPPRRRR